MLDLARKLDEDRRDAAAALEASFAAPADEPTPAPGDDEVLLEELPLEEPPSRHEPAAGPTVLLVDDEPDVRRVVGERLAARRASPSSLAASLGRRAGRWSGSPRARHAVPAGRRPRASPPSRARRSAAASTSRALATGLARAAARPPHGRDVRREAALAGEAARRLAPRLQARALEARPAPVRGRPARVRRQAGAGPRCPRLAGRRARGAAAPGPQGARTPARRAPRDDPALGPRGDATRAPTPTSSRSCCCGRRAPSSRASLLFVVEGRPAARPLGLRARRTAATAWTSWPARSSSPSSRPRPSARRSPAGRPGRARCPTDGPLRGLLDRHRPPRRARGRHPAGARRTARRSPSSTATRRTAASSRRSSPLVAFVRAGRAAPSTRPSSPAGRPAAAPPAKIAGRMLTCVRGARSLVSVLLVGLFFLLEQPRAPARRRPRRLALPAPPLPARQPLHEGDERGHLRPAPPRRRARPARRDPAHGLARPRGGEPPVPPRHLPDHADGPPAGARLRDPHAATRGSSRSSPSASASSARRSSTRSATRRGSVEAIRKGARELPHGLVIFPEGHRSHDGEIRPFRTAGLETILRERRMPVYLVLNEGVWRVRRFADLLFRVHLIDAHSEVMGPFEPPADAAAAARVHPGAARDGSSPAWPSSGARAQRPPPDAAAARRSVARGATLGATPWRCGWHVAW